MDGVSNAELKHEMSQSGAGFWMNLRYGKAYLVHKTLSVLIGLGFAGSTIFLKAQCLDFLKSHEDEYAGYHLQNILWLSFIYYTMHATDQMVEMFSTAFKLEKGALGLFFEMNVLTGIGLFVYIFFL